MAKKKSQKKHNFKYAQPTDQLVRTETVVAAPAKNGQPAVVAAGSGRDFSYVNRDLRRVGILAFGLIAFEVALWYAFNHTGLGSTVYGLIKF